MDVEIFKLHEPIQVHPQLCVREARVIACFAAAKAVLGAHDLLRCALRAHHLDDPREHPPRLRRQLIERAAQHFMRQPVGERDEGGTTPLRMDASKGAAIY